MIKKMELFSIINEANGNLDALYNKLGGLIRQVSNAEEIANGVAEELGKKFLETCEDNEFDFTKYYDYGSDEIFITYSNDKCSYPFSVVYSIYLKDGEIYFNTEDSNEYPAKYVPIMEIAHVVFKMIKLSKKNIEFDE